MCCSRLVARSRKSASLASILLLFVSGDAFLTSCTNRNAQAKSTPEVSTQLVSVGVTKVGIKPLGRELTVSSELVPFQEIDVYAKESGFVKQLLVDYGSRVKAGQLMAVLEIPELELQLQQDDAAIKSASDQVTHAERAQDRVEAQHKVLHLEFTRLDGVAKTKPGLVAQQEVDDAQGKDLAAESQVEESKAALEAARSQLLLAQAKRQHDQVLFDYSKITAPFEGVVTQRYANLGTLMQAGTGSSTQALPLVRLSQDDLFRLVIPVPETYVPYIRVGDTVQVHVSTLNRNFPGKVTRFSVDVKEDTRTMHTEVDVPNPNHQLVPGMYADATLTLNEVPHAIAVPLQAVNYQEEQASVDVVTPDNKVENRPVKLGVQTATDAEVLSGLSEGDLVVVSDRSGLRAGQQVHPQMVDLIQYKGSDQ